ncbi:cytochrome P450 [Mycena rebaudengoi]|nr:cytochrome P450 [Mycena rebaudengoi]
MFQLGILALVAYSLWRIVRWYFKYSHLNNLNGPKPSSFLTGTVPHLYVFDPAALHTIVIDDADIYEEDMTYMKYGSQFSIAHSLTVTHLIWGKGILSTTGEDHRRFRKILQPAFSTTNIREMMPAFYEVAERVHDGIISPALKEEKQMLDLNSILNRAFLEIVGHSVSWAMPIFSPSFRDVIISAIPSKTLRREQDLIRTMHETASNLIHEKREAISGENIDVNHDSKDIMDHLQIWKVRGHLTAGEGLSLTEDELIAQTGMIISAATDTTSSALDRIFHILALNQDIQDKLRAELLEAPEHMTYEQIGSDFLPYMDMVVQEVLRLAHARTNADSVLPLSTPLTGLDGTRISSIPIPKGTTVYVAISAANHNKQIWGDDALEFKPERWTNGKIQRIMSILLRAFKFSAADDRIQWRMAGIIPVPTVNGKVKLPLMVQHAE